MKSILKWVLCLVIILGLIPVINTIDPTVIPIVQFDSVIKGILMPFSDKAWGSSVRRRRTLLMQRRVLEADPEAHCPDTYAFCWTGEYPADNDKAWYNSGANTMDATTSNGETYGSSYAYNGSVGVQFDAEDGYVRYTITSDDIFDDEIGTGCGWIKVVTDPLSNYNLIWGVEDGNDRARLFVDDDDMAGFQHRGADGAHSCSAKDATLSLNTWYWICSTWSAADDECCVDVNTTRTVDWATADCTSIAVSPFNDTTPENFDIHDSPDSGLTCTNDTYIDDVFISKTFKDTSF